MIIRYFEGSEILKSKSELHVSRKEQANEKLNRYRQHEADLKFNVQKIKEIDEVTSERDDLITEIKSLEDRIK